MCMDYVGQANVNDSYQRLPVDSLVARGFSVECQETRVICWSFVALTPRVIARLLLGGGPYTPHSENRRGLLIWLSESNSKNFTRLRVTHNEVRIDGVW